MFANIAPELLAFLRGEAPPTAFVILPAVPEFLVSPHITMALNIAVLLLTLESTGVIPAGWLCLCRQARSDRHKNARDECQVIHSVILSSRQRLRLAHSEAAFRIMRFSMHADKSSANRRCAALSRSVRRPKGARLSAMLGITGECRCDAAPP